MRDLGRVKGFSVLADLTLADSTAIHCQHLLNSFFSLLPSVSFCFFLPLLPLPVFLKYSSSPFCYLPPPIVLEFVWCVLFPLSTVSIWCCTTFFAFSHVGCFSLLAVPCLCSYMPCATYVSPRQKASILGFSFAKPQEDTQLIELLKNYYRILEEIVSKLFRNT